MFKRVPLPSFLESISRYLQISIILFFGRLGLPIPFRVRYPGIRIRATFSCLLCREYCSRNTVLVTEKNFEYWTDQYNGRAKSYFHFSDTASSVHSGCNYKKYRGWKRCIVKPIDIGLNIHFLYFQVLYVRRVFFR